MRQHRPSQAPCRLGQPHRTAPMFKRTKESRRRVLGLLADLRRGRGELPVNAISFELTIIGTETAGVDGSSSSIVVWDRVTTAVLGWLTSLDIIAGCCPPAADLPLNVIALRANAILELVGAISKLPSMRGQQGRDHIVGLLSWQIASAIPRHPETRFDVLAIVRTCLEYAGGLAELVTLLQVIDGDACAMRRVETIVAAIGALVPAADPTGARSVPATAREAGSTP
jgi:hypothetical protein